MEGEGVDPRVKDQLECLNTCTDEINTLELQLDDANTTFRNTLSEYSHRLKLIAKKLGKCVRVARPYYEAEEAAQAAKVECERAAVHYHRACGVHRNAREAIALAEKKFKCGSENYKFDATWQEMLNRETIKLMNAEALKKESEQEHKRTAQGFSAAVQKVKLLEQKLKKDIVKSRSYFEQKKVFLKVLEDLKIRVESLQKTVADSKSNYASCLHQLEMISSEIHERRKLNLPLREPGVGAEWESSAEITIHPPLSMLNVWDSDSQMTEDSASSATEPDATSELELPLQELSLDTEPPVEKILSSENLSQIQEGASTSWAGTSKSPTSTDVFRSPSLNSSLTENFTEDAFQDIDLSA